MQLNWLVLLPPLLVIALAFITHRVLFALCMGILSGAVIAGSFSPVESMRILYQNVIAQFDIANIYTFGFLLSLGALITLISYTGGTIAYGRIIKKRLTNPRNAETASMLLSFCFAIDDFFSILTVGSIMKPVTDTFKIPRIKLAFLIDSLAAPMIILVPFSTWVAMILMQLEKAGVSINKEALPIILEDPFAFYLQSIPFIFYSFIIAASVFYIIRSNSSWGLMRMHEEIAQKTGNLFGGAQEHESKASQATETKGTLFDFLFPLGSLIAGIIIAVLYLGDSVVFGGPNSLAQTMQKTDIFLALFAGGVSALVLSIFVALITKKITLSDLPILARGGYELMKDSIAILFLAWTFGSLLKNNLHTGEFLAQILVGSVSSAFLPAMFFIAALITAVGTGSSWGTIAVLVPLAIPLVAKFALIQTPAAISELLMALPVVGAIFAGAVAGDHVSPIGTTTIMSATSAEANLNAHVRSQLPYATPALISTFIAYIVAGYTISYGIWVSFACSLGIGLFLALSMLFMAKLLQKKA
ncbi:MAG TPA: Na+/H+ antiporter NhaC family protein [Candidatus Babeliales bacterium]|nr:Na+/H+ antiporter NhaC family protein [Candidatus Babeliales bacterium]